MGNSVSVIIPTVQKALDTLSLLIESLDKDDSVHEIIVINNKPEENLNLSSPKIRVITPQSNLYVNPSWNLGVKEAVCDAFALINDDLIPCDNFCKKIVNSSIFNNPDTGLIGMSGKMIRSFDEPYEDYNLTPEFNILSNYLYTGDWGVSIFGRKQNYYNIPDNLKIIYGDNYLLYKNQLNNKINYEVINLPCRHMHSASSSAEEFESVVVDDIENSKMYFPQEELGQIVQIVQIVQIEYREDVCLVDIPEHKLFLSFRYKNDGQLISPDKLQAKLARLIDDNVTQKEDIISSIIVQNFKS